MAKNIPNDLGPLQAGIAALQAEQNTLRDNIRDQSDLDTEQAAYVAQAADRLGERIRYAVLAGIVNDLLIVRPRADGAVDIGPLLVALLGPDVLAAALNRYRGELPPAGTNGQRAARMVEIAAEIDRLERLEEDRICELEAQGLTVDRRGDARPEIVLAIRN